MEESDGLFPAIEIRDAIGKLADGYPIDPRLVPSVRAAVNGVCPTSDYGEQQFVVDVSGCDLFNVGTEELIWPQAPGDTMGSDILLRTLTDERLWEQARRRWEAQGPKEWAAFAWRIAVPLSRRLGFGGAWLQYDPGTAPDLVSMAEPWRLQVAPDVSRDGVGVELTDANSVVFAEVFRCDADYTLTIRVFQKLPFPVVEWLVSVARDHLGKFECGTPLPPRLDKPL